MSKAYTLARTERAKQHARNIVDCVRDQQLNLTQIAACTGLSTQSVYLYVKMLVDEKRVFVAYQESNRKHYTSDASFKPIPFVPLHEPKQVVTSRALNFPANIDPIMQALYGGRL